MKGIFAKKYQVDEIFSLSVNGGDVVFLTHSYVIDQYFIIEALFSEL